MDPNSIAMENLIYCFLCNKLSAFKEWKLHASHQSEVFKFPPIDGFSFVDKIYHKGGKYIFSMKNNFTQKIMGVSFTKIKDEEERNRKQTIFQLISNHERNYLPQQVEADLDEEYSLTIFKMPLYKNQLKDKINQLHVATVIRVLINVCEDLLFLLQNNFFHGNLTLEKIYYEKSNEKDDSIYPIILGMTELQIKDNIDEKCIMEFTNKSYWPPEFVCGEKINEKFDVWCLGIIIHKMFGSGKHPLEGGDNNYKQLHSNLRQYSLTGNLSPSAWKIQSIINDEIKTIIKGCLVADPSKRMSMEYLLNLLKKT